MSGRIPKDGIEKYIAELKVHPQYKSLLKDLSAMSKIEMKGKSGEKETFYKVGIIKPYDNCAQVELAVRFKEVKYSKELEPEVVIFKKIYEDDGIVVGSEMVSELHKNFETKETAPDPAVYAPQIYTATTEGWMGLETSYAIVYPFIPGITLAQHISELKTDSTLFEKLVNYAQQVSQTAAKIEAYNLRVGNKDPWWNYSGFRCIWDFKPDNFLVQNEKIIFFDYQPMKVNPYNCFLGLFNDFLASKIPCDKEAKEVTPEILLQHACFDDIPTECKKQFAEILQTDYMKTSFKELFEKLTNLQESLTKTMDAKKSAESAAGYPRYR